MAKLVRDNTSEVAAIFEEYERRAANEAGRRGYVGGSAVGEECERKLWYSFRWVKRAKFPGRILRLFETGHREEERIIDNLRSIGMRVLERDPSTGEQWRWHKHNDHFSCAPDGVVLGIIGDPDTPHILEVKTSGEKAFKAMQKSGVKRSKPVHYAQMMVAMGLASDAFPDAPIRKAFYVMQNKNTDDLYTEIIEFDQDEFAAIMEKALRVISAETPPVRIGETADFFGCRFCDYKETCHGTEIPDTGCRTCVHSTPVEGAQWECEKKNAGLAHGFQLQGCDEHLFIPDLLPWAEPLEFVEEDGVVRYRVKETGLEFQNGGRTAFPGDQDVAPVYMSSEIKALGADVVGRDDVEMVKRILGAEVVE